MKTGVVALSTSSPPPCSSCSRCPVLTAGQPCVEDRQGGCKIGTICDADSICRLTIHQNCTGQEYYCKNGTVCDSLKRCKLAEGAACREDRQCVAGANCNSGTCQCTKDVALLSGGTCEPVEGVVGGKCQTDCADRAAQCNQLTARCECKHGYAGDPRRLTCAKITGEKCFDDSECRIGMICDPQIDQCRLDVGELCEGDNKDYCMTGTVCDFDLVCRLDLNGFCGGARNAFCVSGTNCDRLEQCKRGVGDSCDQTASEDVCIAGATCSNSVCVCNLNVSIVYGSICEPADGRFGASCEIGEPACVADNTVCEDGGCACESGYRPDKEFSCVPELKPRAVRSDTQGFMFIVVGAAAAGALLVLGAAVVARRRQSHKKEALQEVRLDRNAALKNLSELRDTVYQEDTSPTPERSGESGAQTMTDFYTASGTAIAADVTSATDATSTADVISTADATSTAGHTISADASTGADLPSAVAETMCLRT